MRKGKFEKKGQCRSFSAKSVALMLACVLLIGGVVGGTVAWLTDKDDPVVNTFSISTIGVELKEHTYDATTDKLTTTVTDAGVSNYKMIPGWTIPKDPQAWITSGSEAAYLFVEIKESENFDSFMTYAIADGWTLLNNTTTVGNNIDTATNDTYVIYRKVAAGNSAANMDEEYAFNILYDDKVAVRGEVTKEMMTAEGFTQPTLTFTAYVHQLYMNEKKDEFVVGTAWSNLSNPSK